MPETKNPSKEARVALARRIASLPAKARLNAVLEATEPRAVVRSFAAYDLYASIVEIGLADSNELVRLASVSQFRAFVDLAAWHRDRLDTVEVLRWLRAARGGGDAEFTKKLKAIDLEVFELLLRAHAVVHDLEESPEPEVGGVALKTSDGRYLVDIELEGPDGAMLRTLVQDWISREPVEASRLLEAVRWELPSELEEQAFRFRQARLADLGFPELATAMELFTFVAPNSDGVAGWPEGADLVPFTERVDYVEAAFRGLSVVEREALEEEVRGLVNRALVAELAEPGDPAAMRRISEAARDYLCLGLEHLTHGRPGKSAEVVARHELKKIFQVGFSVTLALKFEADRLAAETDARIGDRWMVLPEEEEVLRALRRRRPLRALKVEGAEPVTFRCRREIGECAEVLERARVQVRLLSGLLRSASPGRDAALAAVAGAGSPAQRVLGAAIAWYLLDSTVRVQPVPALRLTELSERLAPVDAASVPSPAAVSRCVQALAAVLTDTDAVDPADPGRHLENTVERCLGALAEQLATARAANESPRRALETLLPIAD